MDFPGLGYTDVVATRRYESPIRFSAQPHFDGHEERGRIRSFFSQCPLDQDQVRELIQGTGLTVAQLRTEGSTGYHIMYGVKMTPPEAGATLTGRSMYDGTTRASTVDWTVTSAEGQNGAGAILGALFGFAVAGVPGIIVFTGAGALGQEVARDARAEDPVVKAQRALATVANAAPYGMNCALERPLAPGAGLRK